MRLALVSFGCCSPVVAELNYPGMTRQRVMALCFALGSVCFLIGPFPGYANLVGDSADAVTFFVGSILFTAGGGLQSWLAWPARRSPGGGRAAWWSSIIQSAGTLFFNVTTYRALHVAVTSSEYNKLVWRPDWRGSVCFLISGAIAYRASPRHAWRGWLPKRGGAGWWQPAVNLLGCVFFGISAICGYVVPSTGSILKLAAANWNTCLGAACFLACALDTLHSGDPAKLPRFHRLHELEQARSPASAVGEAPARAAAQCGASPQRPTGVVRSAA